MARYVIIIEKAEHNYSAYVPDIDGVVATGATVGEVTDLLREALEFHLEAMVRDGELVPDPAVIASAVDVIVPAPLSAARPCRPRRASGERGEVVRYLI